MLKLKYAGHIVFFLIGIWLSSMSPCYGNGAAAADAPEASFYEENGVERVLASIGPRAEARIKPFFDRAGIAYPASRLGFVVVKEEMEFEVWAEKNGQWVHVRDYAILAASGWHGPKLRQGDRQVPEGIYQIISLNPASRFHLSMKINYPNDYDLQRARDEKRSNLGGDIFIHGKDKSHGCLAIGDTAIEELFVLVAKTGLSNVKVVITPHDMRKFGPNPSRISKPAWLPDLYQNIWHELSNFKVKEGA